MGKEKKKVKGVELELPKFQMSYPHLFEQATYEGEKVGYTVEALFPKDNDITPIKKAIFKAKVAAFGKDKSDWPKFENTIHNGDEKEDSENYKNHFYIKLKSTKRRPIILDKKRNEVDEESEVYGGRYATAAVMCMCVKSGKKWYVSFYIQAIMLLEKGEPFGGTVDTDKYFKDHEGEDDSDDSSNYDDEPGNEDEDDGDDDDIYN